MRDSMLCGTGGRKGEREEGGEPSGDVVAERLYREERRTDFGRRTFDCLKGKLEQGNVYNTKHCLYLTEVQADSPINECDLLQEETALLCPLKGPSINPTRDMMCVGIGKQVNPIR